MTKLRRTYEDLRIILRSFENRAPELQTQIGQPHIRINE